MERRGNVWGSAYALADTDMATHVAWWSESMGKPPDC